MSGWCGCHCWRLASIGLVVARNCLPRFHVPTAGLPGAWLVSPLCFATISSTFCLQTIGLPAFREGNRINIGDLERWAWSTLAAACEC